MNFTIRKTALLLLSTLAGMAVRALAPEMARCQNPQSVLESLWTPEELKGNPDEKLTIKPWNAKPVEPPPFAELTPQGPPIPLLRGNPVVRVIPRQGLKPVALTFDVCEGPGERTGYDGQIVDYLRENRLPATFFLGGKWMQTHQERAMQLIADPLFEVGIHGWNHLDNRRLTGKELQDQLLWPQQEYAALWNELLRRALSRRPRVENVWRIPTAPRLFRFPYGACSGEALDVLADWGIQPIQWDVVPGDPVRVFPAEKIANVIETQSRAGSIIVCHANGKGPHTSAALPLFVPALQKRGFSFVTVSHLLSAGEVILRGVTCL